MIYANIAIAVGWMAAFGRWGVLDFLAGFLVGVLVLAVAARAFGGPRYARRVRLVAAFVAYVAWELVLANLRVTWTVLFVPRRRLTPGIVAVPLDLVGDRPITLLANLVTLTPGTLSLDVSDDQRTLYVHSIDVGDRDEFCATLKRGFERRVRELFA